jgi:hypothetical protein
MFFAPKCGSLGCRAIRCGEGRWPGDSNLSNADFLAAPSKPMVNRPEGKLMKDENEQEPANFLRKESKPISDRISASSQRLTPEQRLDTLVEDAGAEEKLLICEQVAWRSRCRRRQKRDRVGLVADPRSWD